MDDLSIRSGLCFEQMLRFGNSIYPEPAGACGQVKAHLIHQPWMLTTTGKTKGHEFKGWDQLVRKALEV